MAADNYRAHRAVRRVFAASGKTDLFTVGDGPSLRLPTLRVDYGGSHSVLAPIWAGEGFPKDVERAAASLRDLPLDSRETPVLAARRVSRGAQEWLASHNLSWADEQGRALIAAKPGLLVVRERGSATSAPADPEDPKWSDGSAAVAEHLLDLASRHGVTSEGMTALAVPALAGIADAVQVSAPFVSRTLQLFDSHGWTAKVGPERGPQSRRELQDLTGLLSAWAAWRSKHRGDVVRAHGLIRDADAFVREEIAHEWAGQAWAVTGWVALDRRAPFATSIPAVDLYLDRDVMRDELMLDDLLDRVGLRRVESGARVHLIEADPYSMALLARSPHPHEVSDVRLYADLLRSGVRGEESAEHLRSVRIGF